MTFKVPLLLFAAVFALSIPCLAQGSCPSTCGCPGSEIGSCTQPERNCPGDCGCPGNTEPSCGPAGNKQDALLPRCLKHGPIMCDGCLADNPTPVCNPCDWSAPLASAAVIQASEATISPFGLLGIAAAVWCFRRFKRLVLPALLLMLAAGGSQGLKAHGPYMGPCGGGTPECPPPPPGPPAPAPPPGPQCPPMPAEWCASGSVAQKSKPVTKPVRAPGRPQ